MSSKKIHFKKKQEKGHQEKGHQEKGYQEKGYQEKGYEEKERLDDRSEDFESVGVDEISEIGGDRPEILELVKDFPELSGMKLMRIVELKNRLAGISVEIEYQLHDYARNRDVGGVEHCLKLGADPNFKDVRKGGCQRTALHKVFMKKIKTPMERDDVDRVVELLIQYGADVSLVDKGSYNKWDPLMWAISKDALRSVQSLIKAGAKLNDLPVRIWDMRKSHYFEIALRASRGGMNEIFDWLVEQDGVNLGHLLCCSVYIGDERRVKNLLKKTPPPDNIWSFVYHDITRSPQIIMLLLKDGRADPTWNNNNFLKSCINCGYDKYIEIFEILSQDSRVDLSFDNNLLLFKMCGNNLHVNRQKYMKILLQDPKVLKATMVDPNYGKSGIQLLIEGARYNRLNESSIECLKLMIQAGIPSDIEDPQGNTPLKLAMRYKNVPQEVVDLLKPQTMVSN